MTIHPNWKAQISLLQVEKIIVLTEYSDFINMILKKLAEILLKQTGINKHAIKLIENKQPPHRPIYSLGAIELKIFKTYIKLNLANDFIWLSKSFASILILFICKPDGNIHLYIDYWNLNNLTIKNQYLLPLINESLDWLR